MNEANDDAEEDDDDEYEEYDSILDDYVIRFAIERPLLSIEDPADYVIEVAGEIRLRSANDDSASEVVGWIDARVVQAGRACNDGEPLFDVCDTIDQELHDYASAVYDYDSESIRESISDGCAGADILIVETIKILPAHRGRRLGLLAMRRTIDTFGEGCAAVVIEPFPLQFSRHPDPSSRKHLDWHARMGMQLFDMNEVNAVAKLRKYWAQSGFRRIGKTKYFALDLQQPQPRLQELLRKPKARGTRLVVTTH